MAEPYATHLFFGRWHLFSFPQESSLSHTHLMHVNSATRFEKLSLVPSLGGENSSFFHLQSTHHYLYPSITPLSNLLTSYRLVNLPLTTMDSFPSILTIFSNFLLQDTTLHYWWPHFSYRKIQALWRHKNKTMQATTQPRCSWKEILTN